MASRGAQTPREAKHPAAQPAKKSVAYTTGLIKLAGLAIGVNQGLLEQQADTKVLLFAAFMMAGAQLSETALLALVDYFFQNGKR